MINPPTVSAKLEVSRIIRVTGIYWLLIRSQTQLQTLCVQCQLIAFLQQLCKVVVIVQFISAHILLAAMSHIAQLATREAQAERKLWALYYKN